VFIHPPDLGKLEISCGNKAKRVNGKAKAIENPNIPINGARYPSVIASTSKVPIMGPVQLNDTSTSVKAMKKILNNPVAFSALLSIALTQELGKVKSKPPKNAIAKTNNNKKKNTLNHGLVDKAFKALAPKIKVIKSPKDT